VVRQRVIAAVGAALVLVALVLAATNLQLGTPNVNTIAKQGDAKKGLLALERSGTGAGAIVPDEVLVNGSAPASGVARRLAAVPGVQKVEPAGHNRLRLLSDRDVRPEAAAAVVAAGGRLLRLSVEEPSLEAIYTRYFQTHEGDRHAA